MTGNVREKKPRRHQRCKKHLDNKCKRLFYFVVAIEAIWMIVKIGDPVILRLCFFICDK